jgi:8-hydroxy-5-deazaflavin:NADPH oxidoreductase
MTTIGVIGAGRIGRYFSLTAIAHGYDIAIANRRGPETLSDVIGELGPNARPVTVTEAARSSDFALVAVPLPATARLPAGVFAGKVVVTASNYIVDRDGHIPEIDSGVLTVPQYEQAHLSRSRLVRAFNIIDHRQILSDGTPEGTPDRRALAYAADDPDAGKLVADLYNEFGFDAVDAGGLADAWRLDVDQPTFVVRQNAEQLRANLAAARRHTTS